MALSGSLLGRDMSEKELKRIIVQREMYETAELNDVLYLQRCGFTKIENLSPFLNVVALFLDGNGIKKIEGLSSLKSLKQLYLSNNVIEHVEWGLEGNAQLEYLNLSHNRIKSISRDSCIYHLSNLVTLNLSNNRMSTPQDLLGCPPSLTALDISHNQIDTDGGELIQSVAVNQPNLLQFYASGNPGIRAMVNYRKRTIAAIRELIYLDSAPIKPDDRAAAEAFCISGKEAEAEVRVTTLERKRMEMDSLIADFRRIQNQPIIENNFEITINDDSRAARH